VNQLDTVFVIDDERLAASQTPQIAHCGSFCLSPVTNFDVYLTIV
jgi:hypothetical protein